MMGKLKESLKKSKNLRILTTFVCIFLACLLIFGVVFGTVYAIKHRNAVIKYGGITMEEETVSFFMTYYKAQYMKYLNQNGVMAEDTKGFWNTLSEKDKKTYGELLKESFEGYMRDVLVANYLYDNYASLSKSDKQKIKDSCSAILEYSEFDSKKELNRALAQYGFSYSSMLEGAQFLYKAAMAANKIYGAEGENLATESQLVRTYLSEYSHVKLLFIRTESAFVYDESGNIVVDEDGNYKLHNLDEGEKAQRQALINEIRSYIDAKDAGADIQMGETMFNNYLKEKDEGDPAMRDEGYYFHSDAKYTMEFSYVMPEVVSKAAEMSVGSFDYISLDFAECFIYKLDTDTRDISKAALEGCFSDFYSDIASKHFAQALSDLEDNVVFTELYSAENIIELPYNSRFIPKF
jgi:hypothetical protein